MRDIATRQLATLKRSFAGYTSGQKAILAVGLAALLLGGFMLVRWISAPSYVPLFSDLSAADASAVIDSLDSRGVQYEIADGGSTITVPRADVYTTRIALSGEGIPAGDTSGGYSILDNEDLSTSKFKEQTDFKRAIEGELAKTIESIDGIKTAVVHVVMPQKAVFADDQKNATASVLVSTLPGRTLTPEQVQAIVHLVSSSVEDLPADQVTVADSTGRVLSAAGEAGAGGIAGGRQQQIDDYQNAMAKKVQTMLDTVVGPNNSTVQVTADLDFDETVTESTRYFSDPDVAPLSESNSKEDYQGTGAGVGSSGVVGADGQMGNTGDGDSSYTKEAETKDNAVDKTVERRTAAPGGVSSLHVGVAVDRAALKGAGIDQLNALVTAAVGLDTERGDSIEVSSMAFDRSAEKAAKAELDAADSAAQQAMWMSWAKTGGLILLVIVLIVWALRRSRRQAEARREATNMVVEQLRSERESLRPVEPAPAVTALNELETDDDQLRAEIAALVESQPEEVATMLRGWLVDK